MAWAPSQRHEVLRDGPWMVNLAQAIDRNAGLLRGFAQMERKQAGLGANQRNLRMSEAKP